MPPTAEAAYTVRKCRNRDELEACVRLQQEIWGYPESEVYPLRLFVNLAHIGGHVIGAFGHRQRGAEQLVGFVAGMPAWRDGERYLHSLSLGVARGHENLGLGRRLKLKQRELALAVGVRRIEWTFDPLRAKNAFFNIVRLGAIARRFLPDYYGDVRSRLQQGLPSDRLVCEWWLRSLRVRAALAGRPLRPTVKSAAAEVVIPVDFRALAEKNPARARRLQRSVRRQFQRHFRASLAVTGFLPERDAGRYFLDRFE
jgi:predicted GNAT superfamily acetyltransferase